jgi:tetratricopeptide (TPR) repeat protein
VLPATAGRHPLRVVDAGVRLTRPQAAQAGIDASRGEVLTFLDDDDDFLDGHVAGLVAMRTANPVQGVHYMLARVRFGDGRIETWGQPFALAQLYERNFVHLSTALVDRALAATCRFDEAFDIMEDWDFFLQCAQHGEFHFEPRCTFEWHADLGTSGAGAGANADDARFARYRDRIYEKWRDSREALFDFVHEQLDEALACVRRGDAPGALALCDRALARSPNDPWTLNLIAMIERGSGHFSRALAAQGAAVAVRPQDAGMICNLAVLCRDAGDMAAARRHSAHALALAPADARAAALAASLRR